MPGTDQSPSTTSDPEGRHCEDRDGTLDILTTYSELGSLRAKARYAFV